MPTTRVSAIQLLGNPLVLWATSMPPCESVCFCLISVLGEAWGKGIFGSHQLVVKSYASEGFAVSTTSEVPDSSVTKSQGLADSW